MNRFMICELAFLYLILLPGIAFAQFGGTAGGYPFDVPSDPRSVSMGESFVALPSNPAALMYNPAGLAGLQGMTFSYSRRGMNWVSLTDDWSHYSVNAAIATPFGVFAAQYNRFFMGTYPTTTAQYPDGAGFEMAIYSHDVALGFATNLGRGFALGIEGKYYDLVETYTGPESGTVPTTPAYLFDFGIDYTLPPFHEQTVIEDSVTVGASYQNVGTGWKVNDAPANWYLNELPRYFRIGLAYALKAVPGDKGDLSPFSAVLSGEFRSLQSKHYPPTGNSYWGVGLECTIFELVSLRGGAVFKPLTTFEGEEDRPAFRFGAGLNIPLQRIGAGLPLVLSLQYVVVPLYQREYYDPTTPIRSSINAFSLDIQYTATPW